MIPPAYLAVLKAANEVEGVHFSREMAYALTVELEKLGYTVAPTYAFDHGRIPKGVKLPEDIYPDD